MCIGKVFATTGVDVCDEPIGHTGRTRIHRNDKPQPTQVHQLNFTNSMVFG